MVPYWSIASTILSFYADGVILNTRNKLKLTGELFWGTAVRCRASGDPRKKFCISPLLAVIRAIWIDFGPWSWSSHIAYCGVLAKSGFYSLWEPVYDCICDECPTCCGPIRCSQMGVSPSQTMKSGLSR